MGGPRIEWTWTPHDAQRKVLQSSARFRVVAAGRRFGKTEMSAAALVRFAIENPDTTAYWAAPTYNHAEIAWDAFMQLVPDALIEDRKRTHPRELEFQGGSRVSFRSTDHRDNLRGPGLDYLVLDEAAFMAKEVWAEILRPTLADTGGRMIAISTPNGQNWFYDLYQRGQSPDPEFAAYESWQFPTSANPHVPETEIESAKREHSERVWRTEWLATFEEASGSVFGDVRDSCVKGYDWETSEGEPPYRTGVDLARTSAYTVAITLDANGVLVNFARLRDVSWSRIQREIETIASEYPGEVKIDSTRDNKLVSDLADSGVGIRPVRFTSQSKRDMIENLEVLVDRGDLTLPDIPPLLSELGAFRQDVTDAGNVRYRAQEGFTDDCVDALALATYQPDAGKPQKQSRFHLPDPKTGRYSPRGSQYDFGPDGSGGGGGPTHR